MKTARKVLLLVLCAALLVSATVMGTLAYLKDDDAVTNTFTVGKVEIVLDEEDVDGSKTNTTTEGRDKANAYHLLPGSSYDKDPTVHVAAGSEACYVFVKVVNNIASVEADTNTIADQIAANGWAPLENVNNVYYKTVAKSDTQTDLVVFEEINISGAATNAQLSAIAGETVVVTAYAIQQAEVGTAEDAWIAGGFQ